MPENLSRMLTRVRKNKNLSLRQVEKDMKISNAYLSQLETGKALKPSPHILHRLAEYYHFPYEKLMKAAGYVRRNENEIGLDRLRDRLQTALLSSDLTHDEEEKVAEFVEFLRSQRKAK